MGHTGPQWQNSSKTNCLGEVLSRIDTGSNDGEFFEIDGLHLKRDGPLEHTHVHNCAERPHQGSHLKSTCSGTSTFEDEIGAFARSHLAHEALHVVACCSGGQAQIGCELDAREKNVADQNVFN